MLMLRTQELTQQTVICQRNPTQVIAIACFCHKHDIEDVMLCFRSATGQSVWAPIVSRLVRRIPSLSAALFLRWASNCPPGETPCKIWEHDWCFSRQWQSPRRSSTAGGRRSWPQPRYVSPTPTPAGFARYLLSFHPFLQWGVSPRSHERATTAWTMESSWLLTRWAGFENLFREMETQTI